MDVCLSRDGTVQGFLDAVNEVTRGDAVKSVLVLACASNDFPQPAMDSAIASFQIPIFGGLFPGILHEDQLYETGTIAIGLPVTPVIQVVEGLSRDIPSFEEEIDTETFGQLRGGTMFVIVDGMSLRVNTLLSSIANIVGMSMAYIGGGASSLDFEDTPSVICNGGLKKDCAVIAHIPNASGIGIGHGMKPVAGPFAVTSAHFTHMKTLDWKPAAAVYKDQLSQSPLHEAEKLSFIGTDWNFCFGLNRLDSEPIILEPVQETEEGELIFMQELRQNEIVNIMHVDEEAILRSAVTARTNAIAELGHDRKPSMLLSFDCVSRKLFLEQRFHEELEALSTGDILHVGALSFGGEIGTSGKDYLDYHNRTCVVGAMSF